MGCYTDEYTESLEAEIERLRAALRPFAAKHQFKSGYSDVDLRRASEAYGEIIIEQSVSLLKPASKAESFDASTPEGAKKARKNADNYRKNLKPFA